MPSANMSFTSSFSILIPFVSFPCQTAVARASDTMLKKGGESGNPCPIHDLTEDAFSFSPLSMMLAVGLSYMASVMLRYVPAIDISPKKTYRWPRDV